MPVETVTLPLTLSLPRDSDRADSRVPGSLICLRTIHLGLTAIASQRGRFLSQALFFLWQAYDRYCGLSVRSSWVGYQPLVFYQLRPRWVFVRFLIHPDAVPRYRSELDSGMESSTHSHSSRRSASPERRASAASAKI